MKQQTSVEFLIIAGAIGILILGATIEYGKMITEARSSLAYSGVNYSVQPNSTAYAQKAYVDVYLPQESSPYYQNQMGIAAYGCGNGTIHVSIASSSISFAYYNITQEFYGVWTSQDSFVPSPGLDVAQVAYALSCGAASYNGSETLSTTYYQQDSGSGYTAYSAYMYDINQSVAYELDPSEVPSLSVSSHCTYQSPFYATYPILSQCGSDDAWEYMVASSTCSSNGGPFTETVCILPQPSGYNISTPSQYGIQYSYSMNLSIGVGAAALQATLSSPGNSSPLYYMGKIVGEARIVNVSSGYGVPGIDLLSGPAQSYVNSTSVGQYEQSKNSLYSVLAYYNGSIVPETQSEVEQAISSYNASEDKLLGASSVSSRLACTAASGVLRCAPTSPIYYVISATVYGYPVTNQTISYQGSTIRVMG